MAANSNKDYDELQEAETQTAAEKKAPATNATAETGKNDEVVSGKGLDIGTANLVCAKQDTEGEVEIKSIRNAFLDIESDDFTKSMLTRLKVPYISQDNHFYVIGETAFELANVFNRETRRPMHQGLISPQETDAMGMIRLLIEDIMDKPATEKEICYYSVPAEPVDSNMNVVYHKSIFESLLTHMGYAPKPLVEGHAVVLAELSEEDFSGIGISCGGGMFNVCVAFKGVAVIAFSTSRGGDWIDTNAGMVTGIPASRITAIKEKGVDLTDPQSKEQEAIVIYYRNLINYTLKQISNKFKIGKDLPNFPDAIEIVCSGGTSLINGFVDVFKEEFDKVKFPLDIKNIRLAEEPLNTVAYGCLVAAMSE